MHKKTALLSEKIFLPLLDILNIILSCFLVFGFISFVLKEDINNVDIGIAIFIVLVVYFVVYYITKMYSTMWQSAGTREFILAISSQFIAGLISVVALVAICKLNIFIAVAIISLINIFTIALRFLMRVKNSIKIIFNCHKVKTGKRTLIIGAGDGATSTIREMRKVPDVYNPVVIVDDNPLKKNTYLLGILIAGNRLQIEKLVRDYSIELIVIAIATLSDKNKREIIKICKETGVEIKLLPSVYQLMEGKTFLEQIRNIDITDLLGRDEIILDHSGISDYLTNKTVLVTGGGGSIGAELCRQIASFKPKKLIVLDVYENSAYDIQNELLRKYPNINLEVYISSVRDKLRLDQIFARTKPNVVFHAAAHKHVPLMEFNPGEAIKNNVLGTLNTVKCADKYGVERFVLISTDKAVNPTNVMGATKRICEMIVQGINKYSKTEYVAVRFGNVLGSNGSVIPLFDEQIKEGGPVTVTHKDITRFFMSIPEASQLVLQAGAFARGGEIFVLNMGSPVKIYKLAEDIIRAKGLEPHKDIEIKITGLRPGEKLYEELLMDEEGLKKTAHNLIFITELLDINYGKLLKQIKSISDVANNGNDYEVIKKLEEIVPTYKHTTNDKKLASC